MAELQRAVKEVVQGSDSSCAATQLRGKSNWKVKFLSNFFYTTIQIKWSKINSEIISMEELWEQNDFLVWNFLKGILHKSLFWIFQSWLLRQDDFLPIAFNAILGEVGFWGAAAAIASGIEELSQSGKAYWKACSLMFFLSEWVGCSHTSNWTDQHVWGWEEAVCLFLPWDSIVMVCE